MPFTVPRCLRLVTTCLWCCFAISLSADDQVQTNGVKRLILPGESFLVAGRPAFILWPTEEKRQTPQPWIMYAPTLPAYPDQHEKWMHEQFVAAGIAVAGIDVGEAYGSLTGQQAMSDLHTELTEKRGFAKQVCLLGRSRGGLWVSSWAIRHPEKVSGIAGIYPVFDLLTYPGLQRASKAYQMSPEELKQALAEHNPIQQSSRLAEVRIPVSMIHGDVDQVVPFPQNSGTLHEQYRQQDALDVMELIVARGQGHNHWPGFFHCQNVVDFAIERARVGAGLTPAKTSPETQLSAVKYKDLEFQQIGERSQLLDLYRPKEIDQPVPVVMWVHGGGWKNGSKDRCPAAWLTEHGFAVVSINYRLTDEAQWPAQIDDCRAAVRWIRQNAEGYRLDGNHIAAWGGSAGGHLVAVLGTGDAPADEKISSRVQAVCDWYGPSDLLTMPPNVLVQGRTAEDLANSNGAKLLGGTVRDLPEVAKQASALYQVSADDPPFLVMHGAADPQVPLEQSVRLHDSLLQHGVSSQLQVIPEAGHGGKEFQAPEVREVILQFFDSHLKSSNGQ